MANNFSRGDETDIERISPTIHRTEVRIVSTPPHSWVRNSNLSLRIYVSIFLRKKGRRHLILHGGSMKLQLVLVLVLVAALYTTIYIIAVAVFLFIRACQ